MESRWERAEEREGLGRESRGGIFWILGGEVRWSQIRLREHVGLTQADIYIEQVD